MKKLFVILIMFLFALCAFSEEQYVRKYNGYPQGTFKKSRTGKIIQYDKNGKKVGVYSQNTRRFIKTK